MSRGSLRDISLYREPSDDVNSLLNLKTARHARQKNWRTRESLALRQVPVHQASSGTFRNSCMWATVHLSKNEEQCQRVLQIVHTDRSRLIFRTVHSQIQRIQADLLYGSARTSGLDRTPLGEGADYLIRTFHFNCSPHCTAHRFSVMSRWKMSTTSKTRRCLIRSEELLIPSRPPEYCQLCDIAGEQVVVRVEHLPMTHNGSTSHRSTKDVRKPEQTSGAAQRTDHLHVDVQRR